MAGRATHGSSRIPLPAKSSPLMSRHACVSEKNRVVGDNITVCHNNENGIVGRDKKGFEPFLMTGEMVIKTNTPDDEKPVNATSVPSNGSHQSHIPRLGEGHSDIKHSPILSKIQQQKLSYSYIISASPKMPSKIPGPRRGQKYQHNDYDGAANHPQASPQRGRALDVTDFPIIQAPVAEMEELSDLSQSSCSESELGLCPSPAVQSPSSLQDKLQDNSPSTMNPSSNNSCLEEAVKTIDRMQATLPVRNIEGLSDISSSYPEHHSSCHSPDPHLPEKGPVTNLNRALIQYDGFVSDETLTEKEDISESHSTGTVHSWSSSHTDINRTIVLSSSGEKFVVPGGDRPLVRTSKSHENYLQAGTGIAIVNIDIEDNLAYSLDALTYHDSPSSSTDNVTTEHSQMSRSLHSSPEKKCNKGTRGERESLPGFISLEDSKPIKFKLNKQTDEEHSSDNGICGEINNSGNYCTSMNGTVSPTQRRHVINHDISGGHRCNLQSCSYQSWDNPGSDSLQMSVLSDDTDADSLYHQPSKAVDKPSAERLAKRLFNLEGFRKSDVSRHLCKKNDFSNFVAEEYLKFFFFQDDTLDVSLRKFLNQFSLFGETQERERVLAHFSHRFMECNPGSFNSEDACHTLTCAIMLLNSDLHAPNVGRRMMCQEFIENLAELNDGEHFSKEVLKNIYQAIKNDPLEWAVDDSLQAMENQTSEQTPPPQSPLPQGLGSNPFLEVPDQSKATEYKTGYVMKKCCMEPDKRKTPFGKRGWKMMYAVLRDLILYMYKDDHHQKKGQLIESTQNVIRIHHALATKATDYTKKQHVFRLQTADWAEFLFQTGEPKEVQTWVDTINMVAATLSAPPLPGAVGSRSKFQRPLLPSTYTKLNMREQLNCHERTVQELEQDLHMHHASAPEKGAKSSTIQDYLEKESYLDYELKRFNTYVYMLQGKLVAYPELEPSLVETAIGECEEMAPGPSSNLPSSVTEQVGVRLVLNPGVAACESVQRSLSDSSTQPTDGLLTSLCRVPVVSELTESTKM